jgi:release factor glutamine methyltransferase
VTHLGAPDALATALAEIGCVAPEAEAAALLSLTTDPDELAALVARRAEGVPLQVLVGYADFGGLRIAVTPGVFLPRPRSELLARAAVRQARTTAPAAIADVCCGTGALAAVVATALPSARVVAADADPVAVACAADNGAAYGFEVVHGDLCAGLPGELRGALTVIVANVPHVPTGELRLMPRDTRTHEPAGAHDGGADGLDVLRRLAAQARGWLAPAGVLLVEVADHQVPAATAALHGHGYAVDVERDAEERTSVLVSVQSSIASTSASDPSR